MNRRSFLQSAAGITALYDAVMDGDRYRESFDGYVWSEKMPQGNYCVRRDDMPKSWRGVSYFEVTVADSIMHRRLVAGDRCLLRKRPGRSWEVVFRDREDS